MPSLGSSSNSEISSGSPPPELYEDSRILRFCYCHRKPFSKSSHTVLDPGRRFFACNKEYNPRCHLFKWCDEAMLEEIADVRHDLTEMQGRSGWTRTMDRIHSTEISQLQESVNNLKEEMVKARRSHALLYEMVCDLVLNKMDRELEQTRRSKIFKEVKDMVVLSI
ncbi:uncharacterized protein At4g04775-like [Eutrema salsugineum]|uniref:uncharacterized protein At4g04775-like n=1 Tax=Eutrema salsugineum TaxID=72664 RepID=UPI000CED4E79|nr:uncharacterized protein At4g04775-like [Eutrema salsugineum]